MNGRTSSRRASRSRLQLGSRLVMVVVAVAMLLPAAAYGADPLPSDAPESSAEPSTEASPEPSAPASGEPSPEPSFEASPEPSPVGSGEPSPAPSLPNTQSPGPMPEPSPQFSLQPSAAPNPGPLTLLGDQSLDIPNEQWSYSYGSFEGNVNEGTVPVLTPGSDTCNPSGTTTLQYEGSGVAHGPYPGTYTETGTIVLGPQSLPPVNPAQNVDASPLLSWESSFTIVSGDTTITGTRQIAPNAEFAFATCAPFVAGQLTFVPAAVGTIRDIRARLSYSATFVSSAGSTTRTGESAGVVYQNDIDSENDGRMQVTANLHSAFLTQDGPTPDPSAEPSPEPSGQPSPTPQPSGPPVYEQASGAGVVSATTDGEADGATVDDTVETTVTLPASGSILIEEGAVTQSGPAGYTLFGQRVRIETDVTGTVEAPIRIDFLLDASILPSGPIAVFRDGVAVAGCADPLLGHAAPDPCMVVSSGADGDRIVQVWTTHASDWTFGTPQPERIEGTVRHPDGSPLADVQVELCSEDTWSCIYATSDAAGQYAAFGATTGSWFYQAYPQDPALFVGSGSFTINALPHALDITLALRPTGAISGRVLSAGNDPVANVSITLCTPSSGGMPGGCATGPGFVSDGAGEYRLSYLADGDYIVSATPYGSRDHTRGEVSVSVAGGAVSAVDIILGPAPTGAIQGTVTDHLGQPVAGITVNVGSLYVQVDVVTQADGSYAVTALPDDVYEVAARYADDVNLYYSSDNLVDGGVVTTLDIQLPAPPTGVIHGRLSLPDGSAFSGQVQACSPQTCLQSFTDGDGQYRFEALAAFDYILFVYDDQWQLAWIVPAVPVAADTTELDIVIAPPTGGVSGRIVDQNGAAVVGATVYLCGFVTCDNATSDELGAFVVTTFPGPSRLYIEPPAGWLPRWIDNLVVGDAIVDLGDLAVEATGTLIGTVLNTDGSATTGVFVQACDAERTACTSVGVSPSGEYQVNALRSDDYAVQVYSSSDGMLLGTFGPAVVVGGSTTTFNVVVPPGPTGSISGLVVGEDGEPLTDDWGNPVQPWVNACLNGYCRGASAAGDGSFRVDRLLPGTWTVTVHPPTLAFQRTDPIGAVVGEFDTNIGSVTVRRTAPPPAGTTVTANGQEPPTAGGIPLFFGGQSLGIETDGCLGGNATYVVSGGGNLSGTLTEGPDGHFSGSVQLTFGGPAEVSISIACPDPIDNQAIEFNIYIDPSGYVRNTLGEPIPGATVILLRSDSADGPFLAVENQSTVMSPSNRQNPDTTDATGHFGWDVTAGYYKVRTRAPGCSDPADHAVNFVDTRVYEIPPPVFDIDLRLWCGEEEIADTTAPTIRAVVSGDAGANGWFTSPVTINWEVEDPESAVASTDGCDPQSVVAETNGVAFACTASSAGGTSAEGVTVKVDLVDPSVSCAVSLPVFVLNATGASVAATVTDDGSGPAATTVSATADTSAVGMHSVVITGNDLAGRSATASCAYQVVYRFVGFAAPIDNGIVNLAKAGQAIPVKWRLLDAFDAPVTNLTIANLSSSSMTCEAGAALDEVEQYATGSTALKNLGDGYYSLSWRTINGYAKTCRAIRLDLGEGTLAAGQRHEALFRFK